MCVCVCVAEMGEGVHNFRSWEQRIHEPKGEFSMYWMKI